MTPLLRRAACRVGQVALAAEAWCELARAALLVRRAARSRAALRDALRLPGGGQAPEGSGEVMAAVARASRYHLKPMRCLERSLAALAMLRRRGHCVRLCLGCRASGSGHEFHAWVVDAQGAPLGARGDEVTYGVLRPERRPSALPG
jgi:hypothetical protein